MEATEIKKELYKQKPIANFKFIRKGIAYYETSLLIDSETKTLYFEIPTNDMGDSDFTSTMDGKLLIRWLIKP